MTDIVRQGETYTFDAGISGTDIDGFSVDIAVMQYPGDTPAISRALTLTDGEFPGTLTSAETAALAVGTWFIHIKAADSNEDLREPIKLYIAKGWI